MNIFAKVMKVTSHTGLWDAKLAWYSPSATHQICLYGWEHNLWIHGFRVTWPCLIIEVLATLSKFLELSVYCTTINLCFTFHIKKSFCCFGSIMAQFEFIKHKFPNLTMLHVHLCGFQILHEVNQCTMCQHTNYRNVLLLQSWNMCASN